MSKKDDRSPDSVVDHRNAPSVPAATPQVPNTPTIPSTSTAPKADPTSGFSPQNPDNVRKREETDRNEDIKP